MASGEAPLVQTLRQQVDASAATADGKTVVGEAPFAGTVTRVEYVASGAVTGAASPASRTLAVVNKAQDGTGTTAVATLALVSGVDLAAADAKPVTLSSTAADLTVADGDVLEFTSTHVGATGLADPGGVVEIDIARD